VRERERFCFFKGTSCARSCVVVCILFCACSNVPAVSASTQWVAIAEHQVADCVARGLASTAVLLCHMAVVAALPYVPRPPPIPRPILSRALPAAPVAPLPVSGSSVVAVAATAVVADTVPLSSVATRVWKRSNLGFSWNARFVVVRVPAAGSNALAAGSRSSGVWKEDTATEFAVSASTATTDVCVYDHETGAARGMLPKHYWRLRGLWYARTDTSAMRGPLVRSHGFPVTLQCVDPKQIGLGSQRVSDYVVAFDTHAELLQWVDAVVKMLESNV
jgi:hypothetical protein